MGTLYWNSIQLHENFYAQHYDISVTYSPFNRQSGTYQINVTKPLAACTSRQVNESVAMRSADCVANVLNDEKFTLWKSRCRRVASRLRTVTRRRS